jgi:hypothetical protein
VRRITPPHRFALIVARAALSLAPFAAPALGQADAGQSPETWRLTVHPQPVAAPALAHTLLPHPTQQVPGEAAPLYLTAAYEAAEVRPRPAGAAGKPEAGDGEDEDLLRRYLDEVPLAELPANDVEAFLRPYESWLTMIDRATLRAECNLELLTREQGVSALVPHLNPMRGLANVAALRVRLHIARGEYEQATRAMRPLFRLARCLAERGVLLESLVGTGIAAVGTARVQEFVQRPDAPNLYWALADLPRPFISFHDTIRWERAAILATFPHLKDADTDPLTAGEWNELVNRIPQVAFGRSDRGASVEAQLGPAALGAVLYPRAKQFLLRQGLPAKDVQAMPVSAALGRYLLGLYREQFDEMAKWAALPYWQARPGLRQAESALKGREDRATTGMFLSLIPAVSRAAAQYASLDRRIAALQTVEAIRAHAASAGKLPASLEDLAAATPAPVDPTTGQPFRYRVEGENRAVLESPATVENSPRTGLRIELTLSK